MRTPVHGDDASVQLLVAKHHPARGLQNQRSTVVALRQPWHHARDATRIRAEIPPRVGRVGRVCTPILCSLGSSLLCLRCQGRNSAIRRIHNKRRSPVPDRRAVVPDFSVRAGEVDCHPAVAAINAVALKRLLFDLSGFLVRKHLFPGQLTGSLHGGRALKVPDALQVRRAPRCPGRGPVARRGPLGLTSEDCRQRLDREHGQYTSETSDGSSDPPTRPFGSSLQAGLRQRAPRVTPPLPCPAPASALPCRPGPARSTRALHAAASDSDQRPLGRLPTPATTGRTTRGTSRAASLARAA